MWQRGPALRRTHRNTVYGAGRQAQLAARALLFDDGMHQLVSPDDGVDRARRPAVGAANTEGFVDDGDGRRRRSRRELGNRIPPEQVGKAPHGVGPARRT